MRLKTSVFIALFVSIILIGSIIMLGFVSAFFLPTFFFFILLILMITLLFAKDSFTENNSILFAMIAILLIAGFATYFAGGVKAYLDNAHKFTNENSNLVSDIDTLNQNNSYSLSYISYLQEQIGTVESNSKQLQSQIDSLQQSIQDAKQSQETTPIITHKEHKEEDEFEDD